MAQKKKRTFLLKAAAVGSGSFLAACSSGPIAGLPVEDAGHLDASTDAAGPVGVDSSVIDAGSMPVDGGGDSGPIIGTAPQDAGDTDSGPIHGIIIHDAGFIGNTTADGG